MESKYAITSTSSGTAKVSPIVLSESDAGTTRLVMLAELIENPKDPNASVKFTLVHQRKSKKDAWEDFHSEPLSKLKAGEATKFNLDTSQTRRLVRELYHLYSLYKIQGVPWGESKLVVSDESSTVVAPENIAPIIRSLLDQGLTEELWEALASEEPDLATRLARANLQGRRRESLIKFEEAMTNEKGEREFWDDFFQMNTWIFGYGLEYRFLSTIQSQPDYGGVSHTRKGAQRGDFLTASRGVNRFTVLVEIKAPTSPLLEAKEYRNGAFPASSELAGGVSQLQNNCRTWELEGSRRDASKDALERAAIWTFGPKGVLVIGNSSSLTTREQRASFELFRRNLRNPEVVTFDELLERARFIVGHDIGH